MPLRVLLVFVASSLTLPAWVHGQQPEPSAQDSTQGPAQVVRTLIDQHNVLQVPGKGKVRQSIENTAPNFPMPEGASPVVLLQLPEYYGPYMMTVKSSLTGAWRTKRIFVPSVLLFDADLRQTRVFQEATFKAKGTQLETIIPIGEPQKAERFVLLYTRGNALGKNAGRVSVTSSGAISGAAGAVLASALIRTERSTEGHIEVETKPAKK